MIELRILVKTEYSNFSFQHGFKDNIKEILQWRTGDLWQDVKKVYENEIEEKPIKRKDSIKKILALVKSQSALANTIGSGHSYQALRELHELIEKEFNKEI